MVASSMSIAGPNTILNTIVANVLSDFADELEKADNFDLAVHDLIKKTLTEHQKVIFNGNGYSDGWIEEAQRRGLPNVKTMVDAIPELTKEKTVKIFEKFHVLSKVELESRAEINYELYAKTINIEAKTMIEMASKKYIPAIIKYTTSLANSINSVKSACLEADLSVQTELLKECSSLLAKAKTALENLKKLVVEAAKKEDGKEKAEFFKDEIMLAMQELREPIDKLEMLVDKEFWPVPSYGDLLFEV